MEPVRDGASRIEQVVASAPVGSPRRRLGTEGAIAIALVLTIVAVDVAAMPRVFAGGDADTWQEETASLLRERSLAVPHGIVLTMQGPTEDGKYFVRAEDGRWYSKYGLANSLMFVPPMAVSWALGRTVPTPGARTDILVFGVYYALLAAATGLLLFRVTRWYSARPLLRAGYVLACLYGTYLWFYQRAQYSELYQVLFFTAAFHFTVRLVRNVTAGPTAPHVDRRALLGAWAAIAALVLTRLVYAVLLPLPFVALAAAGVLRNRLSRSSLRPALPYLLVPPVLVLGALGAVNWAKFGAPWLTGYHQWTVELTAGRWSEALLGLLFDVRWSVLLYFPPLALSLAGVRSFVRRHRPEAVVMYFAFAAVLAVVASFSNWRGEWSYGPRYVIFALPVVSLPFLVAMDDLAEHGARALRWIAGAVAAAVLGYSAMLQAQVARLDFWAWYDLRLPLRGAISDPLAKYFYEQPAGEIYRDLLSHRDDLRGSVLMQTVRADSSPEFAAWYGATVSKVVRNTNWYWSPPDEP
jgi:hypothetical protein